MKVDYTKYSPWIISYKGHGMVEKSRAETSIGHVVLHELRHLNQYRAKALWEGRDIVEMHVDIHIEIIDGVPVAVAGEAVATFGPPEPFNKPQLEVKSSKIEKKDNLKSSSTTDEPENEYDRKNLDEIRRELALKEAELSRIEEKLKDLEAKKKSGEDVSQEMRKLENEREQLKEEIKKLKDSELKKLTKGEKSKKIDIMGKRFIDSSYGQKLSQLNDNTGFSIEV